MTALLFSCSFIRRLSALATVVLFLVGIVTASLGQDAKSLAKNYALIYGTVWGPDNTPAAGVPVSIRRASDKKPKWQLVSDRRGEFAQRVPPRGDGVGITSAHWRISGHRTERVPQFCPNWRCFPNFDIIKTQVFSLH